ncbi:hypothetical protein, partial [Bradyrhizobium sp. SZCCHNR3109]
AGRALSRAGETREYETQISPAFRERVALAFCVVFFGLIAIVVGVSAFFASMLVDWNGVTETAIRVVDLG